MTGTGESPQQGHSLNGPDPHVMAHHAGKRHSEFSLCVQALARLHPAGLADDWADKLAGQGFFSRAQKATFEHYMQVCTA